MWRAAVVLLLVGCNDGEPQDTDPIVDDGPLVPAFGSDETRQFTLIADDEQDLAIPRDLQFHPERTNELWVVNRATDGVVILFDPGTPEQDHEERVDRFGNHFMEEVSSLSFGADDTFGSCQESTNTYDGHQNGDYFMGPALWPAGLDEFAEKEQFGRLLGSHIDMLHQSPLCMGIEHVRDNAYFVYDGYNEHIVYYDFQHDHGYGYDDHSDGIVRRYVDVEVTREPDVPSHLALDHGTGWMYVADTGEDRLLRFDIATGEHVRDLMQRNEPLAEFSEYGGVVWEELVDEGLDAPSGLAIDGDWLFVSNYGSGEIVAYDLADGFVEIERIQTPAAGIMGLEVGPDGKLWYVDGEAEEVVRVDP